jgi:pyruvate,water dikinase
LSDAGDAEAVRGAGTGGRAIGRVAWHRPGVSAASDTVLVAKTLLPTELPLIGALAIVTETGGPLDHVAAQARERGIPAVVGAHGASNVFADGDLVLVDGDAGLVVRLGSC